MQRWHLTLGLTATALGAAVLAPRLLPRFAAGPAELPVAAPPAPPPLADAAPQATGPGSLSVTAGLDRDAVVRGRPDERFLVIELTGPDEAPAGASGPVDLAVVVDASGSMSAEGKIGYARDGARYLVSELSPQDSFALVTFADFASTVVPLTPVLDRSRIGRAIDRVAEGGSTNLGDGLAAGAAELARAPAGDLRRLVLLSDGQANVGLTDPDALAREAARLAASGVTISTVGLGLDYNEDLLAKIADLGGGAYEFVDTPGELRTALAGELDRQRATAARAAHVDVRLPAGVELLEVLGWEPTRTADGFSVFVGDVQARAKRKIVARVRVTGTGDRVAVATVDARWDDVVLDRPAAATIVATAAVTDDPRVAAGSTVPERAIAASQAYRNARIEQSNRAYKAGRRDEAKGLLADAEQVLSVASHDYAAPALAEDARRAAEQASTIEMYDADSEQGKRAVKQSQELSRARAK